MVCTTDKILDSFNALPLYLSTQLSLFTPSVSGPSGSQGPEGSDGPPGSKGQRGPNGPQGKVLLIATI